MQKNSKETKENGAMLSDNIKRYRKEIGMSQDELAEKLDVSRQSVSLWETGQTQPTIENVISLAKIFGITSDALLADSDGASPAENDSAPDDRTDNAPDGAGDAAEKNPADPDEENADPGKKKKTLILVTAIAAAAVIAGVILMIVLFGGGNKKDAPSAGCLFRYRGTACRRDLRFRRIGYRERNRYHRRGRYSRSGDLAGRRSFPEFR